MSNQYASIQIQICHLKVLEVILIKLKLKQIKSMIHDQ